MEPVRIVQITDLHLESSPGSRLYDVDTGVNLERVIGAISKLKPRPEVIIATGDLAEDASPATYIRLRKILLASGFPVFVLAGNHDNVDEMQHSLVGGNIKFEATHMIGEWVFMFINSQVPGQSYGMINDHEMTKLQNSLTEVGNKSVLLALHHSPMSICSEPGCQLKNADDLTCLAESESAIKGIIGGHTHTEASQQYPGHVQFTSPSCFAQVLHNQTHEPEADEDFWASHRLQDTPPGFRVLDLFADGAVKSEVHWVPVADS